MFSVLAKYAIPKWILIVHLTLLKKPVFFILLFSLFLQLFMGYIALFGTIHGPTVLF